MGLVWVQWELRRRWRALLGLVVLVACSTAVVGATMSGAGRAATSLDRLLEVTDPATLNILPNEPGWEWEPVRQLPEVAAMATYWVTSTVLIDGSPELLWLTPDTFSGVEEPVLLEGRLPAPGAVDEVVVTPNFPERSGKGVGDTVTLELYRPRTVADAVRAAEAGDEPPSPDGPVVEATIVGIERSYWTSLVENDYATFLPDGAVRHSTAFGERYRRELSGDPTVTMPYENAYVRLHGGEADVPAFTEHFAELTGRSDVDMWNMAERHRATRSSIGFEAWALLALAVVAALVAALLVGQAAGRMGGSAAAELGALEGAGLSRADRAWLVSVPVGLAAVSGAVLGTVAAIIASRWFPIGTAAMYEPRPGTSVATFTLGAVALAAVTVPVAAASAGGWSAAGVGHGAQLRRSSITAALTNAGAPVPVVTGTRFALERGTRSGAVPTRPTLVAVVAGVAGMVATLTFATALDDASGRPERWGETWDLVTPVGGGGSMWADPTALRAAYGEVPGVDAVELVRNGVAEVDGRKVALWSASGTVLERTVLTDGRAPRADDEMLLGPTSARTLAVDVGDTMVLSGPGGPLELKVSGLALTPSASHSGYDDSGWVAAPTFDRLFAASGSDGAPAVKEAGLLTWLEPGVDRDELVPALREAGAAAGAPVSPFPAEVPGKINALARVGALPQVLGLFLVVLGIGAVAHTLLSALARRRGELAVLRALGQTPRQTRMVAFSQAVVTALVGIVVGLPLGVAAGRLLWRVVARSTPVAHQDPPWLDAVVLASVGTLVLVVLLAVWPARRAARLRLSGALRAE